MPLRIVKCIVCGKDCPGQRKGKKYCSNSCRVTACVRKKQSVITQIIREVNAKNSVSDSVNSPMRTNANNSVKNSVSDSVSKKRVFYDMGEFIRWSNDWDAYAPAGYYGVCSDCKVICIKSEMFPGKWYDQIFYCKKCNDLMDDFLRKQKALETAPVIDWNSEEVRRRVKQAIITGKKSLAEKILAKKTE